MAVVKKVTAPDGREWEVRSYRFRWPGFLGFRSSPDPTSPESSYTPAALLVRLLLAVSLSLVLFILMSIVKALLTPFRRVAWVDAISYKPEQKRLSWKTTRAHARSVAEEVADQIAGGRPPMPQHAKPAK
jgi:hypothetical protein